MTIVKNNHSILISSLFIIFFFKSVHAQYGNCNSPNPCDNLSDYTISGQKWNKNHLKYFFINGTDDIAGDGEKSAFEEAFRIWSSVTPLTFEEVYSSSEADIKIRFATTEE